MKRTELKLVIDNQPAAKKKKRILKNNSRKCNAVHFGRHCVLPGEGRNT